MNNLKRNNMKNIFLIPTDKESRLWRDLDSNKLTFDNLSHSNSNECTKCSHEYVYITSDEKLKDGEYGLSKLNEVIKFHSGYDSRYYMKIVMTSDLELIEDGVQEIGDNFFEWLVLNPTCEEVETERFYSMSQSSYSGIEYEIIIPKEERKKNFYCGEVETLSEKLEKIVSKEPSKFVEESNERVRIREEKVYNNEFHYQTRWLFDWLSKNDYLTDSREVLEKEYKEYLNNG